ncbi:hypothetical protein I79_015299 [Cricetulus griseus]|uniref:Uncharacterized protein n=1 Tax=Cricetulus griseus TaxID=10029 RepID=G3HWE2_CRIGR|nr:hypothetical protein I79_015299 [Cricetulus griseus]
MIWGLPSKIGYLLKTHKWGSPSASAKLGKKCKCKLLKGSYEKNGIRLFWGLGI